MNEFNFLPSFEIKPVNRHDQFFDIRSEDNILEEKSLTNIAGFSKTIDIEKLSKYFIFNLKVHIKTKKGDNYRILSKFKKCEYQDFADKGIKSKDKEQSKLMYKKRFCPDTKSLKD